MRPKAAQVGRSHGLPKIHKKYTDLPSFRSIIDTTSTHHCGVGKFLTRLLNSLTQNVYSIKDSFKAVDRIRSIPTELFDEGYCYFSFDVTSLFTNLPLNKTINIILHRIYKENLVRTNLRKSTLKKLIKDSRTKTTFSFDGKIYKQTDGVPMGSSLGPVLANVIMTEFERLVVDKLIKDGLIKFYIRYVDDTLVLAKAENIDNIMKQFNFFDKSIQFTIDRFEDCVVHFLDVEINGSETDLYYKTTHTGQYCDFSSQTPWKLKISWIKALHDGSTKICSSNKLLNDQINQIRTFMSWNSYPKCVRNSVIKRLQQKKTAVQKDEDFYLFTLFG